MLDRQEYLPIVVKRPIGPDPSATRTATPTSTPEPPRVPDGPADGIYVEDDWDQPKALNSSDTIAYDQGYYADVGMPNSSNGSTVSVIILGFGRQRYIQNQVTGVKDWGVNLPRSGGGNQTNAWVKQRAEEFITGYSANPAHPTTIIGIGTSNGNYNWTCNNNTSVLSSDWDEAGKVWGDLIASIADSPKVLRISASDIESWTGTPEFGTWTACGKGTLAWYDGYRTRTITPNINFGSNAWGENDLQWEPEDLFQISNGRQGTSVSPQVYCNNTVFVTRWADMRQRFDTLRFRGVTVSNGADLDKCNGNPELLWNEAWNALNNGLVARDPTFKGSIDTSVTSFNYRIHR